jgi:hypothetical protein
MADRQATMLMAQAYMHMAAGVALETPLGLATNPRPRACQLADSRGSAAAVPTCNTEAHSGQHASWLEAAVCALACHREQRRHAAEHAAEEGLRRLSVEPGCCYEPAELAALRCQHAEAPGSAARLAPASPQALADAPTPTLAAHAAAGLVPVPPQPLQALVRSITLTKRAVSRRTLFDGAEEAPKTFPAAAPSNPSAFCDAIAARGMGSVDLEMLMSPCRASLPQAVAGTAAAPPSIDSQPAAWQSRKRLRF